jgi:hypothetical protein
MHTDPRIRSLLWQAQRTAAANKRAAALKLYRDIIAEAPESAVAWVGLAELLIDPEEREQAYRHALTLDPGNEDARRGLARLAGEPLEDDEPPADDEAPAEDEAPAGDEPPTGDEPPVDDEPPAVDELLAEAEQAPAEPSPETASLPATPLTKARSQTTTHVTTANAVPARVHRSTAVAVPDSEDEMEAAADDVILYCANHPARSTNLRCNNCGRPICMRCAKTTPVGYRCPQCIREREDIFYTATPLDYLIAAVSSLFIATLAGFIVPRAGFFVIFLGAIVGTLIGRVVFTLVRRRRGRWLPHLVAAAVVIGALPAFLLVPQLLIWLLVYLALATSAAFYQMK